MSPNTRRILGCFLAILSFGLNAASGYEKDNVVDLYSRVEGPMASPFVENTPPGPGAVMLSNIPADYDWWNGCSPTAAGMLFGWWDEAGYDAFPGDHRNLPPTYNNTSIYPADYADARGVVASWAHKQSGMAQSLSYGSYKNHAPNSIADFILTDDGGTGRSTMAWGFENFGAWDDPSTTSVVESQRFTATTVYTSSGWSYNNYVAEINAGRPVHLGLTSTEGGHSVLGVGYNSTGGKNNIILLSTWHIGLQEWEWTNENDSGYNFTVYGATTMQPVTDGTPQLSAYLSLAHTYVSDLSVVVGVGDPSQPTWSTTVWATGGSSNDNLVLTDIDCTAMLSDYLTKPLDWFLEVRDTASGDTGTIQDFQMRYNFDDRVTYYEGSPVAINDNSMSYVYLHTVPEPATLAMLAAGAAAGAFLSLRRRKQS